MTHMPYTPQPETQTMNAIEVGGDGELELISDELRQRPTRAPVAELRAQVSRLQFEIQTLRREKHDNCAVERRRAQVLAQDAEDLRGMVEWFLVEAHTSAGSLRYAALVAALAVRFEAWKKRWRRPR